MKALKTLFAAAAIALAVLVALAPASGPRADTPNLSVSVPGVVLLPVHLGGQYTANVTAAARLKLPFKVTVLGVSATARASGGTSPTLTVNVLDDGTTILSSPITVTAGSVTEGTVSASAIADESVITIDLAIGGTSPTWNDIDVLITLVRT